MNSLQELNNYINGLSIEYTDVRAADVLFDITTPINQSQIVDKGFNFLSSVGINIIEVLNAAASQPTYTINVFNVPGAVITWPGAPGGTTVTNPSTGVYRISGIDSYSIWEAVKYATIDLPDSYAGTFTYTSTINYTSAVLGAQSKSWTTTVVVNDVIFLTTPSDFLYTSGTTQLITNTPQIINVDSLYPAATWTVVITPNITTSISNFTNSVTGGTFNVNGTTKVITITGTRAQVNARLAAISLVSNSNEIDFILTYNVSNSINATTDSAVQSIENYGLLFLSNPQTVYFIEDATNTAISNTPLITEPDYDGLGTYVLTITPTNTNAYTSFTAGGSGGTVSYNSGTKVLTISGTRSQVNDRLANLSITLTTDYQTDFALSYSLTTPRAETANKNQSILCGSNDTEITNMNISRTYLANNRNSIFSSNTPFISDLDVTDPTYTFTITSSFGQLSFGIAVPSSNVITYTGTKSQCNTQLASVSFWPPEGSTANGTFVYEQYKNSVLQLSQTVELLGQASGYNRSRSFLLTASQNWTPDYEDTLYGTWELALVGGGGGGGFSSYGFANRASGGGGGGEVIQIQNATITYQNYVINIGAGGYTSYIGPTVTKVDAENTTAFGYTARGGKTGIPLGIDGQPGSYYDNLPDTITGGSSGNENPGGYAVWDSTVQSYRGGGGGGAGGTDYTSAIPLGLIDYALISGSATSSPHAVTTFTNVPILGGSGSGAKATVQVWPNPGDWADDINITITDGGSGYRYRDLVRIDISALLPGLGYTSPAEDVYIRLTNLPIDQHAGKKGVYIAWEASANSMYGWYGGGGSGSSGGGGGTYWNTVAPSGSIGNLITFAANGHTQTNGLTSDQGIGVNSTSPITDTIAPANSGGGGGGGSFLTGISNNGRGGSGVIGIRIT